MDDLGGFIAGVIVFFLIVYAIIVIIPFIIAGVIILFTGQRFWEQLQRYQLTWKSRLVILIIGTACLTVGFFTKSIDSSNYLELLNLPLWILIFVGISSLTLKLWEYEKLGDYRDSLNRNIRSEENLNNRISSLKSQEEKLAGQLKTVEKAMSAQMSHLKTCESTIIDIAQKGNSRAWFIRRDDLISNYQRLKEHELLSIEKEMFKKLRKSKSDDNLVFESAIVKLLIANETVNRLKRNSEDINNRFSEIIKKREEALKELQAVQSQREADSRQINMLKASKITL
jgi:chaperonin cofactor prefoldin